VLVPVAAIAWVEMASTEPAQYGRDDRDSVVGRHRRPGASTEPAQYGRGDTRKILPGRPSEKNASTEPAQYGRDDPSSRAAAANGTTP